jgi:hypothetical protein
MKVRAGWLLGCVYCQLLSAGSSPELPELKRLFLTPAQRSVARSVQSDALAARPAAPPATTATEEPPIVEGLNSPRLEGVIQSSEGHLIAFMNGQVIEAKHPPPGVQLRPGKIPGSVWWQGPQHRQVQRLTVGVLPP